MEIRLKVIGGKNDGKEIAVKVAEFIIGRGETANLRPVSDLVSRQHCSLSVKNGRAILTDLKSRNGTFLNGNKLEGSSELKPGDRVRVGRLVFEVVIDMGQAGAKKPKVDGVSDAVARAAAKPDEWSDDSVSGWITELDDERNQIDETRQFSLEEFKASHPGSDTVVGASPGSETIVEDDSKKKKEPGKLPKRPKSMGDNSKDAASEVLSRFFNRR